MSSLSNLKGKPDFMGISIKEELTPNERKMIRDFAIDAKEANVLEPNDSKYIWRVQDTPKLG